MLCQLSYCPPAPPHWLLPVPNTPLHGRTKTVVTGHQTTESTDDYHESRTAGIGGTPLVPWNAVPWNAVRWNAVPWNDTSWSEGDGGVAATSPSDYSQTRAEMSRATQKIVGISSKPQESSENWGSVGNRAIESLLSC